MATQVPVKLYTCETFWCDFFIILYKFSSALRLAQSKDGTRCTWHRYITLNREVWTMQRKWARIRYIHTCNTQFVTKTYWNASTILTVQKLSEKCRWHGKIQETHHDCDVCWLFHFEVQFDIIYKTSPSLTFAPKTIICYFYLFFIHLTTITYLNMSEQKCNHYLAMHSDKYDCIGVMT